MSQLPPPLSLYQANRYVLTPALRLLPVRLDSPEARVALHAIALQESRYRHRRQIVGGKPIGPAKSFWQGERGGGMVAGVRTHAATKDLAAKLYAARKVEPNNTAIWDAIERDDVLAAGLARLLLWTDPKPLPAVGDTQRAWALYLRVWRPGKPHVSSWPDLYRQAADFITNGES